MHDAIAPAVARVHAVVDNHATDTVIAVIIVACGRIIVIVVVAAVIIGRVEAPAQGGADSEAGPKAMAVVKTPTAMKSAAMKSAAMETTSMETAEATAEATAAAEATMATKPATAR